MVNYCCVHGCGRNSKRNQLLNFYGLPKDLDRQVLWLKAANREDLLEKMPESRVKYRFCSRHFAPSSIKNKHLCGDAVPTRHLPGSMSEDESDEEKSHQNIVCNSCSNIILGFRYKCVTCPNYDLCSKCEMMEVHPEHYIIRIPKPMKFKLAYDLVQKWKQFFKVEHALPDSNDCSNDESNDDEPITKYVKNYDSGIDLSEDVKLKIRKEVTRVLKLAKSSEKKIKDKKKTIKKRSGGDLERNSRKRKLEETGADVPEVAFADVNEITNQMPSVKPEMSNIFVPTIEEPGQPTMHMKLSEDLSELIININDQKKLFNF